MQVLSFRVMGRPAAKEPVAKAAMVWFGARHGQNSRASGSYANNAEADFIADQHDQRARARWRVAEPPVASPMSRPAAIRLADQSVRQSGTRTAWSPASLHPARGNMGGKLHGTPALAPALAMIGDAGTHLLVARLRRGRGWNSPAGMSGKQTFGKAALPRARAAQDQTGCSRCRDEAKKAIVYCPLRGSCAELKGPSSFPGFGSPTYAVFQGLGVSDLRTRQVLTVYSCGGSATSFSAHRLPYTRPRRNQIARRALASRTAGAGILSHLRQSLLARQGRGTLAGRGKRQRLGMGGLQDGRLCSPRKRKAARPGAGVGQLQGHAAVLWRRRG